MATTIKIPARIRSVRPSNDGTRRYVEFVSLDVGEWSQAFPVEEWNGFKQGEDVVLICYPDSQSGTRNFTRADGSAGTMATSDLVLRVEQIDAASK